MATLLPSSASCAPRMTPGERRFAQRLMEKLEDDYSCWYDVPVGPRHQHPDFVILHPRRGLLILEVKDWKCDQINRIDKTSVSLLTDRGMKQAANPLEQARSYATGVATLLQKDPALLAETGRHQGRLLLPWGYGVVFTNISRKAFDTTDLALVIEPGLVLCQDDLTESVDAEAFQARLWAMFRVTFPCTLTLPQVDRVRWHLFPEVRVASGQSPLFPVASNATESDTPSIPELIRVMDLQQEQLARSLGDGHRIIHGVAGSGKTMILGYRCAYLAQAMTKPVLVLCYNVTLASKLHHIAAARGLAQKVTVRNFHRWCSEQLRLYNVSRPADGEGFAERLVQRVIEAVDKGQIPRAQYGAVLIDEGHDFEPDWVKLVAQMVDPETNSLLVLCDDAQSIYRKGTRRRWSWASVGVQAKGRTTILRLNYRNTSEVLSVACEFAKDVLNAEDAEEDGIPLVSPASAGRHGPMPEFVGRPDFRSEMRLIAQRLQTWHEHGRDWREMAVIYPAGFLAKDIVAGLKQDNIPFEWLNADRQSRKFNPAEDSVKVVTMHSSKGLEFPVVAIPGLGFMPYRTDDPTDEARLLYVAMTRAMDELLLTYHRESAFVERLSQARERVAA